MVRRWSHLNKINTNYNLTYTRGVKSYRCLSLVNQEVTFYATTFFRKKMPKLLISKLRRYGWSRRKHLKNWLFYQNILSNWSQDYRFFRRYNRFILLFQVFKNSYFIFNLPLLNSTSIDNVDEFASVQVTSIVYRTICYFKSLNPGFYKFLTTFSNGYLMYATTPYTDEISTLTTTNSENLLYSYYQTKAYFTQNIIDLLIWFKKMSDLLFWIYLQQVTTLYQNSTLLFLKHTLNY